MLPSEEFADEQSNGCDTTSGRREMFVFKYERTYLVIGVIQRTRRHERSETEQGKYHGQT